MPKLVRRQAVCLVLSMIVSGGAVAGAVFTDSTFDLGNYSTTPTFRSDGAMGVSVSQCGACGPIVSQYDNLRIAVNSVPEPSTLLLAAALLAIFTLRRRRCPIG